MIDEVLEETDRARGGSTTFVRGRRPLTWQLLREGRQVVCQSEEEGVVPWVGLALSYVLLCRASDFFAYDNTELTRLECCLTCRDFSFRLDSLTLSRQNRETVDPVKVAFRVSQTEQTRQRATITQTRLPTLREAGREGRWRTSSSCSNCGGENPVVAGGYAVGDKGSRGGSGEHYTRTSHSSDAAYGGKCRGGEDPRLHAPHSGRIGGAT